jgi:hypothetical protein
MVDRAKAKASDLIQALLPFAQQGIAIVGLEPSCLYTMRDEALALGLGPDAQTVADHALMWEEFLAREAKSQQLETLKARLQHTLQPISVHGHCHQKAFGGMDDLLTCIKLIPGAQPKVIESSCCGRCFWLRARAPCGLHANGRTQFVASGAQCHGRHHRGRWHQLPASNMGRGTTPGCPCGAVVI